MADVGTITAKLVADAVGFTNPMAQAQKQLAGLNKEAGSTGQAVGGLGSVIGKAGVALGAIGAAVGAVMVIKDIGMQAINTASQVQEMENQFAVSFGAGEKSAKEFAQTAADTMGRSVFEVEKFMASTQAMLVPMLGSQKAAQSLSQDFAVLATDLASFYNTQDEDALRAIQAGIVGEGEALKRYGIIVNQATLEEEARRQGIKKTIADMTEAEKVQLRAAVIMRQSAQAQGDAAKTQDSYANTVKRLEAAKQELYVTLGKALIPAMTKLVGWLADGVKWSVEFINKIKNFKLPDWVTKVGDFFDFGDDKKVKEVTKVTKKGLGDVDKQAQATAKSVAAATKAIGASAKVASANRMAMRMVSDGMKKDTRLWVAAGQSALTAGQEIAKLIEAGGAKGAAPSLPDAPKNEAVSRASERLAETFMKLTTPAGILGVVLEAMAGPLEALLQPLQDMAMIVAAALVPIFRALYPVVRDVAVAFLSAGKFIVDFVAGVAQAIAGIPIIGNIIGGPFKKMAQLLGEVSAGLEDGIDALKGAEFGSSALDDLTKSAEKASESLRNIPASLRIATRRGQAASGTVGMLPPGFNPSAMGSGGTVVVLYNQNGPVYGMDDFQTQVRGIVSSSISRQRLQQYGTSGSVVTALG